MDNSRVNALLFLRAPVRSGAGAPWGATSGFKGAAALCADPLAFAGGTPSWRALARGRGDVLASVLAGVEGCVRANVRSGAPAAVLANVLPLTCARDRVVASSTVFAKAAAAGSAGLPAAMSVAQGVGACRSSNGVGVSADVRTPLNLPAHPTQYRARSLFAVWHASQYLVMAVR